jgi:DNA-binding MarR family transcriptional regulator
MGKRSKEKGGKKERRRAETAALSQAAARAQDAGLAPTPGLARAPGLGRAPGLARAPGLGRAPGATLTRGLTEAEALAWSTDVSSAAAPRRASIGAAELAARLASLSTVLLRHLARADTGDGLTRARLSALSLLVLGGPRTPGELAAAEHVRPPTMTRLVQAMEAEGLVVRERHPSDGRSVIVRATPGGEAQLKQGRARQIASLATSIVALADAERQQLEDAADILDRVLRRSSWEPSEPPG